MYSKKKDFSFFPPALIPYKSISRKSLNLTLSHYLQYTKYKLILDKISSFNNKIKPIFISASTLCNSLKLILIFCRLNHSLLPLKDDYVFHCNRDLTIFKTASEVPLENLKANWPGYFFTLSEPP
jgi:hypothetical protein